MSSHGAEDWSGGGAAAWRPVGGQGRYGSVCQDTAAEFVKVPVPASGVTLGLFGLISRASWLVEALKTQRSPP
jgi:hypothetical protein